MSAGLIGKKVGMTRVFTDNGEQVAVTVVKAGPCTIVGKRTQELDQYSAIRLGYGDLKESHTNKPAAGEMKKAGLKAAPKLVREFRVDASELGKFETGTQLKADFFKKGDWVDVTGHSKGRGFAGVFKRHHMAGFVEGHGAHEYFRHGGAIGQRKTPGRVFKNKRMPGHMGTEKVTIQKVKVIDVDVENNLILIAGTVPGAPEGIITIKPTVKGKK